MVFDSMTFEDLTLHLASFDLSCGGKTVRLNFKEFEVMKLLMAAGQRVVSKGELIVKVWGYESGAEDNNVEAYISFLRKKLFYLGSKVEIVVLRKLGYRLLAQREG